MIHLLIEETRTTDLPVIKKEGKYLSEKEYLNTLLQTSKRGVFSQVEEWSFTLFKQRKV